tara:strand:+ start:308 stop:1006 length:699 start_codon:yes stop_codon:yes gene_type:complete
MTSLELKNLVKSHFSLVEAGATEETMNETITENFTEAVAEEVFGKIADENSAFEIEFPGDELEVGDKVTVVTSDDQRLDAPDGEHKLADGITIVTKDSVVESISKVEAGEKEELKSEDFDARTDAEEEGYLDGLKDAKEDMMEDEPKVGAEDIVKEIVEAISEEMGKMKDKMAKMEEKMAAYENAPAVESVAVKSEMSSHQPKSNVQSFSIESAANADRIKLAIQQLKNKQN